MSDKKRPWWKKKTNYGIVAVGISTVLLAFPATTVLATAGPLIITTTVVAKIIGGLGAMITGYGIANRIERTNNNKEK